MVDADVVMKSTVPGWPPSTSYYLMDQTIRRAHPIARSPVDPGRPPGRLTRFRAATALLGLGLLVSTAALCWQSQSCTSLRLDLSSKEVELAGLQENLEDTLATLGEAQQRLSSTLEALMGVEHMLEQTNTSLLEKSSEVLDLTAQVQALQTKVSGGESEVTSPEEKLIDVRVYVSPPSVFGRSEAWNTTGLYMVRLDP